MQSREEYLKHHREHQREYYKNNTKKAIEIVLRCKRRKRAEALKILGNKCKKCGITEKLHLDHIYYAVDSIRTEDKNAFGRINECLKHPERFQILCASCHMSKHNKGRPAPWAIGNQYTLGQKRSKEFKEKRKELMKNRVRNSKGQWQKTNLS